MLSKDELAALRVGFLDGATTSGSKRSLLYDPQEVSISGQIALKKIPHLEKYSLLEQLVVSSIDSGDVDSAKMYLTDIEKQFPFKASVRVQKLFGLLKEAEGDPEASQVIYETALKQDEANLSVRKRQIALLISQGKRTEAITELIAHVDTFILDVEAWTELAAQYIATGMYAQAAFCMEEMMVLRPQCHLYQLRYADLLYTMGTFEGAVKYYCLALEGCKDNVRGLYGLQLALAKVLNELEGPATTGSSDGKENKTVALKEGKESREKRRLVWKQLQEKSAQRLSKVLNGESSKTSKTGRGAVSETASKWLDILK
ncbi:hypothetical protein DFS34DRAFT_364264 [Phlyctochytrium arcticum]|nr:hypothetical protein DFS34DRAFT_364264 [Phlyctochytrium arcticum]